jgi:hypothetical protein
MRRAINIRILKAINANRSAQSNVRDHGDDLFSVKAIRRVEVITAIEIKRLFANKRVEHKSAAHNHHVSGWKTRVVVRVCTVVTEERFTACGDD